MDSTAAVIVTFNRKELLSRCLDAVLGQTRPVDKVFIIDNASTDGTPQFLLEAGYLANPVVEHVRLPTNTGSAGGFCEGMKRAHEAGFDWLWLMDDDGYPAPDCLERLTRHRSAFDVLGPAVVQPDDPSRLTWKLRQVGRDGRFKPFAVIGEPHEELVRAATDGIYAGYANLFNGVLISRRATGAVGYVLPALFIWGDENEYLMRCKAAGLRVGTCVDAFHFHPQKPLSMSKLRFYYLYRNTFYINWRYARVVYPPLMRPLYPAYVAVKFLLKLPSTSPAYLWTIFRAAWQASRGTLVPFPDGGPPPAVVGTEAVART